MSQEQKPSPFSEPEDGNRMTGREVARLETDQVPDALRKIGYLTGIVKIIELDNPLERPTQPPVRYLVEFDATWDEELLQKKSEHGNRRSKIGILPTSIDCASLEEAEAVARKAIEEIDYWNTGAYD